MIYIQNIFYIFPIRRLRILHFIFSLIPLISLFYCLCQTLNFYSSSCNDVKRLETVRIGQGSVQLVNINTIIRTVTVTRRTLLTVLNVSGCQTTSTTKMNSDEFSLKYENTNTSNQCFA